MSDDQRILTERRGHVLVITMNRPQARNAFDAASAMALEAVIDELDATDELFVAVIQHQCEIQQNQIFDLPDSDLRLYLTQLAGRFARLMMSEDVLTIHRIVVAEATRFPEIGEALYEAGPKRGKARLVAYLQQAMAEGRMKPTDPERAAEQAMELCLAGMYRRRLWNVGPPPSDDEIDANVEAGVAMFMAAYGC